MLPPLLGKAFFAKRRLPAAVDLKKKDQWMIKTLAVLGEDPEAKTAVMKGPITLEIVRAAEPGLSLAAAKKKVEELTATFEDAAARGYRLLLPRLDLSARPAIASRIVRECAADELATTSGKSSRRRATPPARARRSS